MALSKAKEPHNDLNTVKTGAIAKKYAPCPLSHEPNEETIQALRDADAGIGLTRCNSLDELWRSLDE